LGASSSTISPRKISRVSIEWLYRFVETDFMETLYKLTKDHDPLVVINAIDAINEISANKGGINIDRPLVIHLLNRIKDFNEWGQSIILDLTAKYKPQSQEEMLVLLWF
jgi:AP-4 complex subunit beta-1